MGYSTGEAYAVGGADYIECAPGIAKGLRYVYGSGPDGDVMSSSDTYMAKEVTVYSLSGYNVV